MVAVNDPESATVMVYGLPATGLVATAVVVIVGVPETVEAFSQFTNPLALTFPFEPHRLVKNCSRERPLVAANLATDSTGGKPTFLVGDFDGDGMGV